MDIIKLKTSQNGAINLIDGEIISDLTSVTWTERYRNAGEFKMVAFSDSQLIEKLPLGTIITHADTQEMMIVEVQEVDEDEEGSSISTVSGRSFETVIEGRIYDIRDNFPSVVKNIVLPNLNVFTPAIAAEAIIKDAIASVAADSSRNNIGPLLVQQNVDTFGTLNQPAEFKPSYAMMLEFLGSADLGVKTYRPGVYSTPAIIIHDGEDKTQTVSMSYDSGDVVSAQYFWTNREKATAVHVVGKWVHVLVSNAASNLGRKIIQVKVDYDEQYSAAPTSTALNTVRDRMVTHGNNILNSRNNYSLLSADISKDDLSYVYRVDYNIGDWVTVAGNYGVNNVQRVVEHVEIEDEDGYIAYPTLEDATTD